VLTPEEELARERHVAEILKIRNPPKEKASGLALWLNSTLLTTLLGVLLTGVIGSIVTGRIQDRSKRNELDRLAQEQRLAARNAIVDKVLKLTGASISAMDDMLAATNAVYLERGYTADEVKKLRKWKEDLSAARDTADSGWRQEKGSLGYTIRYLFDDSGAINAAWAAVTTQADEYERCTRVWYIQHGAEGTELAVDQICPEARAGFASAVGRFTGTVLAARASTSPR
jgi:hypothetical protein